MSHPETIDRFSIVRQVGAGGMGTVYEAVDSQIDRRVALKVLHRDLLAQNPQLIGRLWIEARAANGIHHPGVVQVSEAGLLDDGTGFLVMEFLDGQTLTQRLRQTGQKLPLPMALQIAVQMASTLNAGHQKGIIHRDLKPDNVMLVQDDAVAGGERIKLLDFGIAKIASSVSPTSLTLDDMGLGTPGYMSPEQMRDAATASDRSDVYGLGTVLFEMVAGRRPHVAPSAADLVVMVLGSDPPRLASFISDVPPELDALLRSMLQREPASARPTIVEVLRELVLINARRTAGLPSGVREVWNSPPVEMTPPTISRAGLVSALQGSAMAVDSLTSEPTVTPAAAARISQISGQTDGRRGGSARSSWSKHAAVAVLVVFAFAGFSWWRLPSKPPPTSSMTDKELLPAGSSQEVLQAQKKILSGLPALSAAEKDRLQAATRPLVPYTASTPLLRVEVPTKRHIIPDVNCIHGAGLPLKARRGIATVLSKAEVRIASGESIEMIRQGNTLEVSAMPSSVSRKQEENIVRMLGTALSKDALPDRLTTVRIQCGGK